MIEIVFSIPGIGSQAWNAIQTQDRPMIMGTVLFGALLVTVLALLLDGILAAVVWASVPGSGRLRRPLPQPLLDDEVKFDSRTQSRTPDYDSEQPSPTVEGW